MKLKNDVEFNSDMFLELIVNFQKCVFVDPKDLNFYKEGEGLDTISVKNLETRLEKSFSISVEKVASIVKRKLKQSDLVVLSHVAISLANENSNMSQSVKRKSKEVTAEGTKKSKSEDVPVSFYFN